MATAEGVYQQLQGQYPDVSMEKIGNVYEITSSQFTLFLPEDFSNLTDVYSMYQGAGGLYGQGEIEVTEKIKNSILSENSDKIVCIGGPGDTTNLPFVLNTISGGTGFTNYYNLGWSAGATTALNSTINYITSNPNAAPQTTVLLESANNGAQLQFSTQDLQALKDNNSTIIILEDAYTGQPNYNTNQNYLALAQNANVVIVENNEHNNGGGHTASVEDAFQENILGVISGDASKLEDLNNHYTYRMLNPTTGQFEQVDAQTAIDAMTENVKTNSSNTFNLVDKEKFFDLGESMKDLFNSVENIQAGITCLNAAAEKSESYSKELENVGNLHSSVIGNNIIEGVTSHVDFYALVLNYVGDLAKEDQWLGTDIDVESFVKDFGSQDINNLSEYISDLKTTGKITDLSLPSLMAEFVNCGVLNSSNMKNVIPNMVANGTLNASTLLNVNIECQKLLAWQGVNANGSTNYASSGYFNNLTKTNTPVIDIQTDLIAKLMANGYTEADAYQFANNYVDQYNTAIGQKLVDENLMYSGDGTALCAYATIGLFTSFGYMLDYKNASFESDGENGLMLGTNGDYVTGLDCNNSFDFLARGAGMNASGYNAQNKEMYAVTVDEMVKSGEYSRDYWHRQMLSDGRIQNAYNSDGTFNTGFTNGKAGDIIVCENGAHMLTIVDKDANGYLVAEETSSEVRGSGFKLHYYNFEDINKMGSGINSAYVVNMDNFYSNESAVHKENGFVTYGYDANGNVIEITTDITYGDNSTPYGHCNNYIPPEIIAGELGLSTASLELLKGEYNYRNENNNVGEYNVSDSIRQKIEEIEYLKSKNATIPSYGNQPVKMDVPETGRQTKTWMPASAVTDQTSNQYKFLHSGEVYEGADGILRYQDENGIEYYCVALGTYYCDGKVGEKFQIDLRNEDGSLSTIYCITADIKSDKHTDPLHQYTYGANNKEENNNILEFVVADDFVSKNYGPGHAGYSGDCSDVEGLGGKIESIYYLGSKNGNSTNGTRPNTNTTPNTNSGSYYGGYPSYTETPGYTDEPNIKIIPVENPDPNNDTSPVDIPDTGEDTNPVDKPDTGVDTNPVKTPDSSSDSSIDDTSNTNTNTSKIENTSSNGNTSYVNKTNSNKGSSSSSSWKQSSSSTNKSSSSTTTIKDATGNSDIAWNIPIEDNSSNTNTTNETTIEPIPITPTKQDTTVNTDTVIDNTNSSTSSGPSAIGIALGAAAVTGAAIAGKSIYDKYLDKNDDKDVEEKYFEDYDMSKSNYTVDTNNDEKNDNDETDDSSSDDDSKPEVNPYYT
jgi:hypothetical protein